MASSSRARSSSPFSYRKPSSPYSSSNSSTSSHPGNRLMPRSCSTSASSYLNSGGGLGSQMTARSRSDAAYYGSSGSQTLVTYGAEEIAASEPADAPRGGDSISVTIRFRPLSEREYQRGDEIAWYADGDKIVRNEYNPATAYAFDRVFGENTITQDVYDVAAKPVNSEGKIRSGYRRRRGPWRLRGSRRRGQFRRREGEREKKKGERREGGFKKGF